jgi:hypothetical protein
MALYHGRIPAKRVQPLICKNKLCVNPDHLVTGDEARFWTKVNVAGPEDCWDFFAAHDKNMYGRFSVRINGVKTTIRAHRYSFFLRFGFLPQETSLVCHTCDHPWCVNPNHLFLGSSNDNTQDKVMKGRQARGVKIANSTLTEKEVREIRELTPSMSKSKLSKLYGISRSTLLAIILRKTWKHI